MPPHLLSLRHPNRLPPPQSVAASSCRSRPSLSLGSRRHSLKVGTRVRPGIVSRSQRCSPPPRAFDDGFVDIPPLVDWEDIEGVSGYLLSSSENEDSDGEIVISAAPDADLPKVSETTNEALAVTAHRFAMLGRRRRRRRIRDGILVTLGLISFLAICLFLLDLYAWRIVRLPLPQFYLSRPFFISASIASCLGYVSVPILRSLNIYQNNQTGELARPLFKKITPTMGGLFFVPVGVAVAEFVVGFSSVEVTAAAGATLIFAVIGLLDDALSLIRDQDHYLSAWFKLSLEVAVGCLFSLWLEGASISSPYGIFFPPPELAPPFCVVLPLSSNNMLDRSRKMLIPLPSPLGLVCLGKLYFLLTSICFVSTGNGITMIDGVDGMAGGVAALAFIAMSIVVLPICADLAIFGSSMAGACIGFLVHNRYKASVFMGTTGSLALGGALAAMAACTGMFFPLFISCGVPVVEALQFMFQACHFNAAKCSSIPRHSLRRIIPLHHRLLLYGFKEPAIVAVAYVISLAFCLLAGYTGLTSA
ncbi:hypothetical protein MLD38_039979 [Melastoma candidum]|uniref:Uncharacterized protein n=1 Tax=Melastoma candidum TaxID=119954 RepID=A0ACB9L4Q9_9MYRT|nr:hypothetical protein MLD38_039979 [Melastoma candidum]